MAVAFRSSASQTASATGHCVINKPTGVVDGDILIASVMAGGVNQTPTITAPSGWTLIASSTHTESNVGYYGDESVTERFSTYYKVASGEGSSWDWTNNMGSGIAGGVVAAFSGGDTSTPIDAYNAPRLAQATALGITTITNDALLVGIGGEAGFASASTPPTGMTEQLDTNFVVATEARATAGATGNRTWGTWTTNSQTFGSDYGYVCFSTISLIAIKPAGGGGGGAGPTTVASYVGVAIANISSVDSIAKASIDIINGAT